MVSRRSPRFSVGDEQPKGSELTTVTSSSVKFSDVRSVLLPQPTFDHQGIELSSVTRSPLGSASPLLEAGPNEVQVISTANPDKPSTLDIRNLDVFVLEGQHLDYQQAFPEAAANVTSYNAVTPINDSIQPRLLPQLDTNVKLRWEMEVEE